MSVRLFPVIITVPVSTSTDHTSATAQTAGKTKIVKKVITYVYSNI